jgi:hypothetical protein
MKNVPAMAIAICGAIAALASCTKKKDNTDQLATLGSATVSGKALARLADTVGAASMQFAPAGTVINAWIDTKDLVVNENGTMTFARRYYSTTTDGNGNYSFNIEVSPYKAATVNIVPAEFEYDVVVKVAGKVQKNRTIFSASTVAAVPVHNKDTKIVDITFN